MFWKEVLSWIALYSNEVKDISFPDVFFGKLNINKDFRIINHILLLAKFYIYKCKLDTKEPLLDVSKATLKATYKLELYVARKNDVLAKHYVKWDAFISILS